VSPRSLLDEFKKRMVAAGLPVTKIHELRHISISLLLAHDVDPNLVAQIAGHSNANITAASTPMSWTERLMKPRKRSASLAPTAPRATQVVLAEKCLKAAQCPPNGILAIVST